jgi:hypothetical protein
VRLFTADMRGAANPVHNFYADINKVAQNILPVIIN